MPLIFKKDSAIVNVGAGDVQLLVLDERPYGVDRVRLAIRKSTPGEIGNHKDTGRPNQMKDGDTCPEAGTLSFEGSAAGIESVISSLYDLLRQMRSDTHEPPSPAAADGGGS